ncbi:HaeII family restriction endonuclease [Campylobacter sp. RM16192]|uniref:HaeII family restriction endonuclease n=1 Tax=Campylobacter sp. RM16192 TaxID=1660080 RepID=UPI0014513D16|nr:HaeII family restriction endonuclease [Campylobacter sp. RM16192]QCD51743.1 type II restriction endonuclease, HaeII family [Campylobacter sp. RM16192]
MTKPDNDIASAKTSLDNLIKKSRILFYKPIQIAEILFKHRTGAEKLNLSNLAEYRIQSKQWRDVVCSKLLKRICTSSARFQDDLFNNNAIPPKILKILGDENIRTKGAVEAYIYSNFVERYNQLSEALIYCTQTKTQDFDVKSFIDSFWREPGLKRSIDKIYEIVVYALFSTLVDILNLKVTVSVDENSEYIIEEFEDFTKKVMRIDFDNRQYIKEAKFYRVGITNAADRGLDMYSSWGVAVQIKHLTLDVELAENIVGGISSDNVVIVCKDADEEIILSILTQMGWGNRVQDIVTEKDIVDWYEKALRGKFSTEMGDKLLNYLREEIKAEFPSVDGLPEILTSRHYEKIKDDFWKNNF